MRNIYFVFLVAALLAMACTIVATARTEDTQAIPRYSLPVGRQLTYRGHTDFTSTVVRTHKTDTSKSRFTRIITVLRKNPDESSRIVVRLIETNDTATTAPATDNSDASLAFTNLFPDGRLVPDDPDDFMSDQSRVLPKLPVSLAEMTSGWTTSRPGMHEQTEYAPLPGGANDDFAFSADISGIFKDIYAIANHETYHFDRSRGALTTIELNWSQEYGFHTRGSSTATLVSDVVLPPEAVSRMAADCDLLHDTRKQYQKRMSEALDAGQDQKARFAEANQLLHQARASARTDDVRRELDKMLRDHAQYAADLVDSRDEFKGILNKPSPEWSAKTLDGKPVKLADFKGKTVVMDFWYRGCGWCMQAMPDVKRLSADYANKPVVFLGMNTDQKAEDAKFVIDHFKLKYSTIQAGDINDKYGIHGFPTMVIIDSQGVVRDVHVGYSLTLHDDVAKKIDALLAAPPH